MALDDEVIAALNAVWVLTAGIFCFFLAAGFGLLEAGCVQEKNAQNILLKNLVDSAVASLVYWAFGYAFAYGEGGNPFIGNSYYFLKGVDDYILWFFQMVFAGTTATIVSGAVAERCRFRAYLIYTTALSGFIYPVVSHWIWSPDGFMYGKVLDFSGSGAVHLVGGAAAMAGSYVIGPRIGKYVYHEETGVWETKKIPGHSAVLAALGGFILWMGFFAFNGAACGAFFCPDYVTTGRIVTVTCLAGSAGCLFLLFFGVSLTGIWDMKLALGGLLAGMVASCSGCNVYNPWASIVVGIGGALAYYGQDYLFEHILHIDDPVGAAALHMGAGAWGLLAVGFFANSDFTGPEAAGIFYGGDGKQLGWQILAMLIYYAWAFGISFMMFFTMNAYGMLRVTEEVESIGFDIHHHGGPAYHYSTSNLSVDEASPDHQTSQTKDSPAAEVYSDEHRQSGVRNRFSKTAIGMVIRDGAE